MPPGNRRWFRPALSGAVGVLCAAAIPALGVVRDAPAAGWEVRRAHAGDQKEEWTREGCVPGWAVRIGKGEAPEIDIDGDEKGNFRGFVLVGRRWRIPAPVPAELRVRLRYQTCCAIDDPDRPRGGMAALLLLTPERWETLAADPRLGQRIDLLRAGEGIVAGFRVHTGGDDVTAWRDWESPDLSRVVRDSAGRELVLAVAWGCMHMGVVEWGRFSNVEIASKTQGQMDVEFIEALDLSRAELQAVKRALADGDLAAAKAAFVAHMRARKHPSVPTPPPDGSPGGLRAADEICDHVFRFTGCPPTRIDGDIQWNEDPHNYNQWAIALNRHSHWVTLGRAWAATRDGKYAAEFVRQLNGWLDAMPVRIAPNYLEGPFLDPERSPLSLDAGIRMAETWWPAWFLFEDSAAFDAESRFRMLRSFREHARYLMDVRTFHAWSNWGAMEIAGLMHLGVMMPEFREAGAWLETARARLVEAARAQVYPDGAQTELATGYHWVTLNNFLSVYRLARDNAVALPDDFTSILEKMFEYHVAIVMPDGRTPSLNDGAWSAVDRILAKGIEIFPGRADFEYFASRGRRGAPPVRTSWALPYAGWFVMRSGWLAEDKYLLFEAGPFGAAHQHEDQLGIIVHAGGRTILTEGGNYSYDASDWRRYILSTRAHNTVLVDGREQNRRSKPETHVVRNPRDAGWRSDAGFDFAAGSYECGYGPTNEVSVTHDRQVLFVRPDYWLVVDAMRPHDGADHMYEALFHLDAEEAVVDPVTRSVTAEYDGHGFRILPLNPRGLEVSIVKGQILPVVQGWLPTGRHNELRPIPTAIYRWKSRGPAVAAFALVPRRPGEAWPVAAVKAGPGGPAAIAAELLTAGGGADVVGRERGGRISLDRRNAAGETTASFRAE